ncbi:hypothetical protein [uncultured Dubosiella sp.]|uniref:hypothetical protein n=1 Tax=uncultured Dubosiella sp. TaxID=1937011 RepID=UPI002595018B|nr:hypothetical protein [uncultured Dubosiella sp.]
MKTINLQMFAAEPQNLNFRVFSKEFKELVLAVFGVQAQFRDFFVGGAIGMLGNVKNQRLPILNDKMRSPAQIGTLLGTNRPKTIFSCNSSYER